MLISDLYDKVLIAQDSVIDLMEQRNELKKIFGNKIEKDLIASHFANWSINENFLGAWASAEPGGFKYREILRQSIEDKIYFAGEACAEDWGTVAGAYESGKKVAREII